MILQSFRMALSSIIGSKMRSFLTMLGIIIGVIAVVVLISLVNGATDSVTSEIEGLGSNLLSVSIADRDRQLSLDEIEAINEQSASIGYVAPNLTQGAIAKSGNKTFTATVQGTTADYLLIGSINVEYGRFLKSPDQLDQSNVAVIGAEVADELFGRRTVIGESLSISGRKLLIVGVMAEGESAFSGIDQKVIIPYSTAQRLFFSHKLSSFVAAAVDPQSVDQAEADLENALLTIYRQNDDAFYILNQASILDVMDSVLGTLSLLLGGIAGISLLVGGIGIMNIMLVSVTERTREIGIRKAIGASRGRIMLQFLIESMVISVMGGIIGILISGGMLRIVSIIADMSFSMTFDVIALAVGFSVFVGVVFGLYPANKASRLHPIQALRTE